MARPTVYITGSIPARIEQAVRVDFDVLESVEGADGILALLSTSVNDSLLARAGPRLRVVANYAVGFNNIDVDAARKRGIVVTNTPDVLTRATAELAVTLMLGLLRRVVEGDRLIRRGDPWSFSLEFMLGESLDGKVVGIVGPGRIGRETARLVEAFGARPAFAGRNDDLESFAPTLDVLSLHCPLTAQTRHLVDRSVLKTMRRTSILVNVSRGPIVDESALVEALQAGEIAGAALDVYEDEPRISAGLIGMNNVVLSPHLGSATRDTREAMGMLAVDALRAVLLEGREPTNTVS